MTELSLEEQATNAQTLEHIQNVRNLINLAVRELLHRAEIHDVSKLGDLERQTFVEFTPKLKNSTYGSDEYKGYLRDMRPALENHYKCNRHHPEWLRANEEQWRPILGYEGHYEVNNFGDVRSLSRVVKRGTTGDVTKLGQPLRPHLTPKGYLRVQLQKDGVGKAHMIHRLVAMAFLGAPQEREQVNHKNGDKQDNYLGNLEWVSPSGNLQHAYDEGLREPNVKYIVHCEEEDLTTIGTQKMVVELIKRGYNATTGGVWSCIQGENATHLDLHFTSEPIEQYGPRSDIRFMNLIDLLEMLLDWKAASMRHANGDLHRSIEINTERFRLDPQLVHILKNTVRDLKLNEYGR